METLAIQLSISFGFLSFANRRRPIYSQGVSTCWLCSLFRVPGHYKKQLAVFNKMSASVKADMEVKLKALECHFTWGIRKGDIKELDSIPEKLLDRIMKLCPLKYHVTYFNLLAFLSHLKENNVSALDYLHKAESALKDRQDDTELLVTYANYAWVHYHSGNMDDVEAYLEKLENINKGIPRASKIQGSLPSVHGEKGWSLIRLGAFFYKRVKESFQKALQGEPNNASFNVGYAMVLYRLEGMVRDNKVRSEESEATTQLRKALSLVPDNSEVMVLLALKLQNKNKQESMKLITEALRLSPDVPHVMRYVAKFFRYEGSVNESLHILGKALELSPNSHFLHHQIGLCHKQQLSQLFEQKRKGGRVTGGQIKAKVEVCIRHFSRAVELKPSNIHARVNLAEAYGNNYQLEEALKIFINLVKDESLNDSDKQHCYTSFGLFLFHKKKDEGRAATQFKNAYQIQIESWDRNEAGKKLKQIAERCQTNKRRVGEASEILAFLATVDKEESKAEEPRGVNVDSTDTDDLTEALGKGMKLK
ncbi:interferon-induced protein with tetratricopeptide repeats 5-like isoform X1 [Oncorhynchus keta]|uniref:interferon-induced protein with tetratricopeptide repeats 5-like isoform X1 n=2 Tax=Oncorhynchus keta TaxID=8018 RepID=UPI0015FD117E|nr:interferon-induced protein with tetratricopeptide repeats 5-like isoform X1 [Oncorhynchus keta]